MSIEEETSSRARGADRTVSDDVARRSDLADETQDEAKNRLADIVEETMARADRADGADSSPDDQPVFTDPIPSRMINEFVYCQRLFYYEFVEGVFLHNADTRKGAAAHKRVDRAKGGALPTRQTKRSPTNQSTKDDPDEAPEIIHSRSVSLGSNKFGVTAKLDLVEVRKNEDDLFSDALLCPVEYKVGSPREDEDGIPTLWDTDKIQLGLQILLLRENGYECDEGVIFYRGTRQRVRLPMTAELENWIQSTITEARVVAAARQIPEPLVNSPKCVRCSLAPICLPDETRLLSSDEEDGAEEGAPSTGSPRRLIASRDEKRVLYLSTPGMKVRLSKQSLRITEKMKVIQEIPINDVLHLGIFGNVGVTTPAVRELCSRGIPISYFSMGGWFYGYTQGHALKNVMTRIAQFEAATNPETCLEISRHFVRGKIRNARTMLMRNHIEPPAPAIKRLKRAADDDVMSATSLGELLGIEGAAASVYFSHFSGFIKTGSRSDDDDAPENGIDEEFDFDFNGRNRRPPRDPVNALLSLAYSMLAKDCAVAAHSVGFDPYVGFFHQPRHGRPALALDMMEEFRPVIAESAVLQAINNRIIRGEDFVRAGSAVNLTPSGRKRFFQVWERRMTDTVTHPVFKYSVSYRRAIELQFRLLAKMLSGEIENYIPFKTR